MNVFGLYGRFFIFTIITNFSYFCMTGCVVRSQTISMNKTNYHSHCTYCDGKAPMEEFVRRAVEEGFTSYGISSHSPLPFEASWVLQAGEVDNYLRDIEELKRKYGGQIELYAGMETDYVDDGFNPASDYFQKMPLDYRIGSVHFIAAPDGEFIDTDTIPQVFRQNLHKHFGGDLRRLVRQFFDASMRMVELGGFDFIGHADKVSINADYCENGTSKSDWYTKMVNEYFDLIAEKGTMVEINTKRYASKGYFFPNGHHFKTLQRMKVPVLVNSDAHAPELINDNRANAIALLRQAGFKTVRELSGGKWIDVPIG